MTVRKSTPVNQVAMCLFLAAFSVHSGITYLFQSSIMAAWKQMLVTIFICFCLVRTKRIEKNLFFLGLAYLYIVILNVPFAVLGDADLKNYLLEITSLGAVFLGLLFGGGDRRLIASTAGFMNLIIGIGILLDYKFRYFHFISHNEVNLAQGYRPVFLLGSSTLLFPVLGGLLYLTTVNSKRYSYIVFSCLWVILVAFISGSRASLIFLTMLVAVLMLFEQKIKASSRVLFSLLLFTLLCVGVFVTSVGMFGSGARLFSLLSASDPGNLIRFVFWKDYFSFILPNIEWFGNGLGYLKGAQNIYASTHFESSFISLSIEAGVVGLLVFYFFFPLLLLRISRGATSKSFVLMYFLHSVFAPSLLSIIGLFFVGAVVNMSRTTRRGALF